MPVRTACPYFLGVLSESSVRNIVSGISTDTMHLQYLRVVYETCTGVSADFGCKSVFPFYGQACPGIMAKILSIDMCMTPGL